MDELFQVFEVQSQLFFQFETVNNHHVDSVVAFYAVDPFFVVVDLLEDLGERVDLELAPAPTSYFFNHRKDILKLF